MIPSIYRKILFCFACLLASTYSWGIGRHTVSLSGSQWHLFFDKAAAWEHDSLYLPEQVPQLSALPYNPPTGGWKVLTQKSKAVTVPGTVEKYLTTKTEPNPDDTKGVSWWWRTFTIPATERGQRVVLHFQSVRMRAEVFVDQKLVGYDIVGETPFDVDITDAVRRGSQQTLAIRVTNPGGNFHWQDYLPMYWGNYQFPPSRGFSGIIGDVTVQTVPDFHIGDLYVLNTPNPRRIQVHADLTSQNDKQQKCALQVIVRKGDNVLYDHVYKNIKYQGGTTQIMEEVECPEAELWDLDHPNLYTCETRLLKGSKVIDSSSCQFGFRWFSPDGIGSNALLRLNGKRIVLRSAISWGYFPLVGTIATPDMAVRQVKTAKQLGLNMLNFHRQIGQPSVLNAADSLGLLYFEEPGGFQPCTTPFAIALMNEKVRRMIKRDRSHPSLVIYNMMNEYNDRDANWRNGRLAFMQQTHNELDPSRTMTLASAWAKTDYKDEACKVNFQPYDSLLHMNGWWDNHRAGGPATYIESYYRGPNDNYMFTRNDREIWMRGEEGAISTPPRLERIHHEQAGQQGWDSRFWEWEYNAFEKYFQENNLKPYFHSVDSLTGMMGRVQLDHQGRRIESMRMQDKGDIYVINGWESMPYDNHSGIVDIWRNPKADPQVLAKYNRPLYLAVMPRQQVAHVGQQVVTECYIINEKNLHGDFDLSIALRKHGANASVPVASKRVHVSGGDRYGELLDSAIVFTMPQEDGLYDIEAMLLPTNGNISKPVIGSDEVLAVSWNKDELTKGRGALYGDSKDDVAQFFKKTTDKTLPIFTPKTPKLDWLIVNRSSLDDPELMPTTAFADNEGQGKPIQVTWFSDNDLHNKVKTTTTDKVDMSFADGAQPAPWLPANHTFSIAFDADIIPEKTGTYLIGVEATAGVRLFIDGEQKLDAYWNRTYYKNSTPVSMVKGKPVHVRVGYYQHTPTGSVKLLWSQPGKQQVSPKDILNRAKNDGTTVVILGKTETWMEEMANIVNATRQNSDSIHVGRTYAVGTNWVGGIHFVKDHPLFKGLPVNCEMGWPYQSVVEDGANRYSFEMTGVEQVVGSYRSWPFRLGTAVGVVPYGKGKIVFSTLNIPANLNSSEPAADVARKLLCNYINFK